MTPIVGYDKGSRHLFFICPQCGCSYHFRAGMEPLPRQPIQSRCVGCRIVFTGEIQIKADIERVLGDR